MLDLLAKILGPNRAVTAYVAIQRFGIPVALLAGFAVVLFVVYKVSDPDRMAHLAYVEVDVIKVTPLTQDPGAGVFVEVRLPDGSDLRLTETEGAIARELADRACLEQRQDTRTGEIDYRLRRAHRCLG